MSYILKNFASLYDFHYYVDPRLEQWPLVGRPFQVLAIVVVYYMFVHSWGPKWMKNRQPYKIDKIVMAFDFFQVFICAYLFVTSLSLSWFHKYQWFCEPVDFSDSENAVKIRKLVYYYFLLKISDLMDTVFFVLRKKHRQVSFLHVYHHICMIFTSWLGPTYLPGGHGISFGINNCLVHVVMYTYYFITAARPEVKKMEWLKKTVTQIQIVQFVFNALYMGYIIFIPDCGYPKWTLILFLPNNIFMLVLFVNFYINQYNRKPASKLK